MFLELHVRTPILETENFWLFGTLYCSYLFVLFERFRHEYLITYHWHKGEGRYFHWTLLLFSPVFCFVLFSLSPNTSTFYVHRNKYFDLNSPWITVPSIPYERTDRTRDRCPHSTSILANGHFYYTSLDLSGCRDDKDPLDDPELEGQP